MALKKKPLKIGFRPHVTLYVDGAQLNTDRRNTVTIRDYSAVRWETADAAAADQAAPDQAVPDRAPLDARHNPDRRPREPRRNSEWVDGM